MWKFKIVTPIYPTNSLMHIKEVDLSYTKYDKWVIIPL